MIGAFIVFLLFLMCFCGVGSSDSVGIETLRGEVRVLKNTVRELREKTGETEENEPAEDTDEMIRARAQQARTRRKQRKLQRLAAMREASTSDW